MYKRILVPLDGTDKAEAILPHIEMLVADTDAAVILMQSIEAQPIVLSRGETGALGTRPLAPTTDRTDELEDEASAYLIKQHTRLKKKGIRAKALLMRGPVVEAVLQAAAEESADLIAMASFSQGGLFASSAANTILSRTDLPMFVVRA